MYLLIYSSFYLSDYVGKLLFGQVMNAEAVLTQFGYYAKISSQPSAVPGGLLQVP